jgi:hypothetical protein
MKEAAAAAAATAAAFEAAIDSVVRRDEVEANRRGLDVENVADEKNVGEDPVEPGDMVPNELATEGAGEQEKDVCELALSLLLDDSREDTPAPEEEHRKCMADEDDELS